MSAKTDSRMYTLGGHFGPPLLSDLHRAVPTQDLLKKRIKLMEHFPLRDTSQACSRSTYKVPRKPSCFSCRAGRKTMKTAPTRSGWLAKSRYDS